MTGGHGHVTPRPDGARARCGGPACCPACARELAEVTPDRQRGAGVVHGDEAGRGYLKDVVADRIDAAGYPTSDRAAPEEDG